MEKKFAMKVASYQCVALLVGALCGGIAHAQGVPPVNVMVSAKPLGNETIYRYRIINHSKQPITALQIGFGYYHGVPELLTAPSGSEPGSMSPSAASSPAGWAVDLNATEDTSNLYLAWTANTADQAIPPGGSLFGFSVTVPGSDASYMDSHWTVSLNSSGVSAYSATLAVERFCSAPRLSIAASPDILWAPNHKMVPVKIAVSVSDEVDPNPVVALVSVKSNESGDANDISAAIGTSTTNIGLASSRTGQEKGGRIYTIKYQAQNVCGAQATTSTSVVVPHDQRK